MPSRSGPVILIAEDDEDDVFMLQRALEQTTPSVPFYVVANGEQAIAYLKGTGQFANRVDYPLPDLLLLDLKMPRNDGFEVLEWLRAHPDLAAIRVVVLTSSEDTRSIDRAYRLGAASVFVKPVNFNQLRDGISAMINYWRSNQLRRNPRDSNGSGLRNDASSI
ncbi:MAG TPA: response regulator [Candidatus Binatia bacterium]|nr:response regulator [Candidatus Binatia bacterium]